MPGQFRLEIPGYIEGSEGRAKNICISLVSDYMQRLGFKKFKMEMEVKPVGDNTDYLATATVSFSTRLSIEALVERAEKEGLADLSRQLSSQAQVQA